MCISNKKGTNVDVSVGVYSKAYSCEKKENIDIYCMNFCFCVSHKDITQ